MAETAEMKRKFNVAIITAGGAGMFCGSCMQDNALASALIQQGHKVTLIPTYTPIRVDSEDQTGSPVFLGGINVYLDHFSPLWRKMPHWVRSPLDRPGVIRFLTRFGISNDAKQLGSMTVSLLKGKYGPHQRAIEEFCDWVVQDVKPDVILFSNLLLGGIAPSLREQFQGPVLSLLQGDDVFLDGLIEPWRAEVLELMNANSQHFHGFISHSQFYLNYMREYLKVTHGSSHCIPLGIELPKQEVDFADAPPLKSPNRLGIDSPVTIGYFARLAAEKGLDLLVQAVLLLKEEFPQLQLEAGGYLAPHQQAYWESVQELAQPLGDRFRYLGSPETSADKAALFRRWNLFSVPARFVEPKGISILEALSFGLPVVQPNSGAYPELLESVESSVLVKPEDPQALADGIRQLLTHDRSLLELGQQARQVVQNRHSSHHTAAALVEHIHALTQ